MALLTNKDIEARIHYLEGRVYYNGRRYQRLELMLYFIKEYGYDPREVDTLIKTIDLMQELEKEGG
jgi:hypothetical protein